MAKWKIDRTAVFLLLVFVLFLWDLAFFLGIRDPARFPHPFMVLRFVAKKLYVSEENRHIVPA